MRRHKREANKKMERKRKREGGLQEKGTKKVRNSVIADVRFFSSQIHFILIVKLNRYSNTHSVERSVSLLTEYKSAVNDESSNNQQNSVLFFSSFVSSSSLGIFLVGRCFRFCSLLHVECRAHCSFTYADIQIIK